MSRLQSCISGYIFDTTLRQCVRGVCGNDDENGNGNENENGGGIGDTGNGGNTGQTDGTRFSMVESAQPNLIKKWRGRDILNPPINL